MNTDLTQLFKTVTESVPHYLMFMGLVFLAYSLTIATIKVISDNVVKVVLAARTPVTFKIKDGGELENT
jgi:hypothetical protein